jgi:molybdate transport system substrate-binding protein
MGSSYPAGAVLTPARAGSLKVTSREGLIVRKFRAVFVVVASFALVAAACGSDKNSASITVKPSSSTASTQPALTGGITVLAASSLTNGFTALGAAFEGEHPGTKVTFSFGSSSDLETQIEQGAPADVFASADQKNMDKLVAAQANGGAPVDFAKNKLAIAVEKGNPKGISTLADLAKSGLVVVLCDPSVPCGKFADEVLANAKVVVTPKSREASVKATLSKVELGEADAAIVYVSDVASSGKVDGVSIPDDVNVVTTLPIATVKGSKNAALAQAWVDFVVAHQGELVTKYGFLAR